jgi:hypothetical protein
MFDTKISVDTSRGMRTRRNQRHKQKQMGGGWFTWLGFPAPEDYDDNDDAASQVNLEGEHVVKEPTAAAATATAAVRANSGNSANSGSGVANDRVDEALAEQATVAMQESADLDKEVANTAPVAAAAVAAAAVAAAPAAVAVEHVKPEDVKLLRKLLVKGQLPTTLESHLNIARPLVIMEHLHAFGALGKDTTADAVYARHLKMLIKRLPTNAPILVLLKRELTLLVQAIDNAERVESQAPEVQAVIKAGAYRSGLAMGANTNPFGPNRGNKGNGKNSPIKKAYDTKAVHATLTYYLADHREWRAAYLVYYKLWIGFLGALNDGEFDSCNQELVQARAAAIVLMTAMADRLGGMDASSDAVVKTAVDGRPLSILQRSRALFDKMAIAGSGIQKVAAAAAAATGTAAAAAAAAAIGILSLGMQFKQAAGQLHQQLRNRVRNTERERLGALGNVYDFLNAEGQGVQAATSGVKRGSVGSATAAAAAVNQGATSGAKRGFFSRFTGRQRQGGRRSPQGSKRRTLRRRSLSRRLLSRRSRLYK